MLLHRRLRCPAATTTSQPTPYAVLPPRSPPPCALLLPLQASQQPVAELPNSLMNALASFVASVNEPALVQVLLPLVNAVVVEGSGTGAAAGQGPAGKGKAGLFIMLAVMLRTRPQVGQGLRKTSSSDNRQAGPAGNTQPVCTTNSQPQQPNNRTHHVTARNLYQ